MKQVTIVKIGGKLIDDPSLRQACLAAFSRHQGPKILVHGGGKSGSDMLKRVGIQVKYVNGRRITDAETLRIVTMVYAGEINKSLTAQLQALQCNALGVSGCDLNLIQAHRRVVKDIDYGYAGDIDRVDASILEKLLQLGITPLVSPITHDGKGQLLNTNADTIASVVAASLSDTYRVSLHFCFEHLGVMENLEDRDSLISVLSKKSFQDYLGSGIISSGMIPKLTNAYQALEAGVDSVSIGDHLHFARPRGFTQIVLS